jgi:hypothetical protein
MIMEIKVENKDLEVEVGDIVQLGDNHYMVCESLEGFYFNSLSGKRKASLSFYDSLDSLMTNRFPKKVFKSKEYYMTLVRRGEE